VTECRERFESLCGQSFKLRVIHKLVPIPGMQVLFDRFDTYALESSTRRSKKLLGRLNSFLVVDQLPSRRDSTQKLHSHPTRVWAVHRYLAIIIVLRLVSGIAILFSYLMTLIICWHCRGSFY
jgi:hypothetical protein